MTTRPINTNREISLERQFHHLLDFISRTDAKPASDVRALNSGHGLLNKMLIPRLQNG